MIDYFIFTMPNSTSTYRTEIVPAGITLPAPAVDALLTSIGIFLTLGLVLGILSIIIS
jgi:hypothetical protein